MAINYTTLANEINTDPLAYGYAALVGQRTIRLQTDAGADTNVVANLRRLVTSNTNGSLTRLNAAATRFGSRAKQLFGAGVFVDSSDVARALRG